MTRRFSPQHILYRSIHRPLAAVAIAAGLLMAPLASANIGVPSGTYVLEETHAYITFSYQHLGFSTPHVGFNTFDVTVELDAENPAKSSLGVSIDAASIDSRVDEFDKHLRGDNFFDVAAHPRITFAATSIEMGEGNTALITGDLTIKGITHPVTLETTLNKAANHPMRKVPTLGISALGKLKRSDWDLGAYAPAVGDDVDLFITAELIKQDDE